jgi:phenylacetate-CoA ligase
MQLERVCYGVGMFETGIRQFRLAIGMVWGRRLDPRNIARLVEDGLATLAEFGEPGVGARELVDGPLADPDERREFTTRALRRTARRLALVSPFYARRFAAADVAPDKLDLDGMRAIPTTVKRDLIEQQKAFLCTDASPQLATSTTGTTGRAAEVWMSRYELELWCGMSALTGLLRGEIEPADLMQVHLSSRATASVHLTAAICRLVGARCRILGVIPVDQALDALVGEATLLSASPSYLGELVVAARRRGLKPTDFRLKRVECGGEILSERLQSAASDTFGARVIDGFGMTEIIPVSATTCSQRHLHHDLNTGAVELLDLGSGEPAGPGALSTVAVTPYHPFRECMPVFRYDTRDVVRALDGTKLTCEIAGLPGTSRILGKANQILKLGHHDVITPRDLVEAVESLPSQPWPARFRADLRDGRLILSLPVGALAGLGEDDIRQHFIERGVDASINIVPDEEAATLRLLRCDLRETTFVNYPNPLGDQHASR